MNRVAASWQHLSDAAVLHNPPVVLSWVEFRPRDLLSIT